jgi:hypothetical protein
MLLSLVHDPKLNKPLGAVRKLRSHTDFAWGIAQPQGDHCSINVAAVFGGAQASARAAEERRHLGLSGPRFSALSAEVPLSTNPGHENIDNVPLAECTKNITVIV